MTPPYKVSVIIPCFNHGEFLPEAVASVLETKRDDVEVIVVDDGSTDGRTRKEMDALMAKGLHVIRQENKGLAAARNTAIGASRGEYIFPLDADDRIRPAAIERAIRFLDANPSVGIVYGDLELFGVRTGHSVIGPFNPCRLLRANYIAASALFRRAVWERDGGYDERMLKGFEDWEFWIAAYERGWQFAYVPEALFKYRQHQESMITRVRALEEEVAQFIAAKHGQLYRQAWIQASKDRDTLKGELQYQRESLRATMRNFRSALKFQLRRMLPQVLPLGLTVLRLKFRRHRSSLSPRTNRIRIAERDQ